jgi:hypothetical protein
MKVLSRTLFPIRAGLLFENFEQADDVSGATPWAGRVLRVFFFVFPVGLTIEAHVSFQLPNPPLQSSPDFRYTWRRR